MEKEISFKDATLKLLDEPSNVYYAGQVIHGLIEYEVAQNQVNFTAINVNFLGEGNVSWSETESEEYNGVRRNKNVEYKSREEYFNVTIPLLGRQNSLPRGKHNLNFEFQIPHNAPSTFKSKCGNITYHVIAYIDYADSRRDRENVTKEFEVVAPLNLNNEEGKRPIDLEFEEVYSSCCSSTPMNIGIHIPMTGFVPGQPIPITINAKNESNTEVKRIIFRLIRKVAFRSHRPTSEYIFPEEILHSLKTGPILGHTSREIKYDFVVPDMIAVNLDNCEIIDMGYGLKVTVKLSGCKDDLEDECEIILGVVPIPGSPGSEGYKHPLAHSLPIAPIPAPPTETSNKVTSHQNMGVKVFPTADVGFSTNAYPLTKPAPYPVSPKSHPPNPTAYPTNPVPYPTNPAPYPTNPSPYPTNPSPYPTNPSPYPTSPYSAMPHPQAIPLINMSPGYHMPAPYPTHATLSPGGYSAASAPPP